MKQLSKLTLASAIAVAMASGMGTAFQASATPALDGTDGAWVDGDQFGDVLLFPYYTVRDDANGNPFRTSFTVTNTSEQAIVLKFRLRDHVDSQDVLDFIWILSPKDEVVASMDRDPRTGQPRVNFPGDERSCRAPWDNGANTFTAPGGTVDVADAQEGHLEIIPMGSLPDTTLGYELSEHGPDQDCQALSDIFVAGTNVGATPADTLTNLTADLIGPTADGYTGSIGPVGNVLRGAYSITSVGSGFSAGGNALAVAGWDDAATGGLLFLQHPAAAESSQLDGDDTQQWDHPHLGDLAATANIDDSAIAATSVVNNWSVNPANGVGIDWVVTYYTKYLWRDTAGFYGTGGTYQYPETQYGAIEDSTENPRGTDDGYYDPTGNVVPGATEISPWNLAIGDESATAGQENGGVCLSVDLIGDVTAIYDREEDTQGLVGGVSPGPKAGTLDVCNEANVISFAQGSLRDPVLKNGGALVIDTSSLNLPYGWGMLEVNPSDVPVAVGGFSYTKRDLGQAASYGAITPHDLVVDDGT